MRRGLNTELQQQHRRTSSSAGTPRPDITPFLPYTTQPREKSNITITHGSVTAPERLAQLTEQEQVAKAQQAKVDAEKAEKAAGNAFFLSSARATPNSSISHAPIGLNLGEIQDRAKIKPRDPFGATGS